MIVELKTNASIISKLKTSVSFSKKLLVRYINKKQPIYQTNSITSTSLEKNIALNFATKDKNSKKGDFPILMEIKLQKGISFGLNFGTFSFGKDDYAQEVILSPEQKIKLTKANIIKACGKEIVFIECTTIGK